MPARIDSSRQAHAPTQAKQTEGAEEQAEGAEAKYERAMHDGTERQVAERMAVLETRSTSLREQTERLQGERDAAMSEAKGLRAELDMVSGLRRREQSESKSRLASLEEHVVKMHAASWSLQKAKLLQLQKIEASQDQLRARHATAKQPRPSASTFQPSRRPPPTPLVRSLAVLLLSGCCARRSYTCVLACCCPAGTLGTT